MMDVETKNLVSNISPTYSTYPRELLVVTTERKGAGVCATRGMTWSFASAWILLASKRSRHRF